MINYIDTHIHLDLLENLSKIVKYINENRIYVIAMTNHPKVYEVFKNEINSKFIRVALGMHPELAEKANMILFKKYIHSTKYIGEIGLDFSKRNTNHEQQKIIFNEILNISKQKIFSIHSRDAVMQVLNIIEQNFDKGSTYILHWYTGGIKDMQRAIDLNCYFSINLNMLNSKNFLDKINLIPKNRILIETDAPFSKGNIFNLSCTYKKLSQILNIPESLISNHIFENFKYILSAST